MTSSLPKESNLRSDLVRMWCLGIAFTSASKWTSAKDVQRCKGRETSHATPLAEQAAKPGIECQIEQIKALE